MPVTVKADLDMHGMLMVFLFQMLDWKLISPNITLQPNTM